MSRSRRHLLALISSSAIIGTAGCLGGFGGPSGVNETVVIDNDLDREVTLTIAIEERRDGGEYDPVTETNATVAANESAERDLLGQSQYRVTITGIDQEIQLITRPICDDAITRIIITESRRIDYWVEDCEGIVHTIDGA